MREQFEKLSEIKNKLHLVEFRSDTKKFTDRYSVVDKQSTYKRSFVKGAWYSFQEVHKELLEQQKKIEVLESFINHAFYKEDDILMNGFIECCDVLELFEPTDEQKEYLLSIVEELDGRV